MDLSKLSLTGIADLSNKLLSEHPKLKKANDDIEDIITSKMILKGDSINTQFTVAGTNAAEGKKLSALLEKLDLSAHAAAIPVRLAWEQVIYLAWRANFY